MDCVCYLDSWQCCVLCHLGKVCEGSLQPHAHLESLAGRTPDTFTHAWRRHAAAPDQVCEDAGNVTTVRSVAAPYAYDSRERRRAARARAATFATLIEESDDGGLEDAPACAWPGGWQARIKQDVHKVGWGERAQCGHVRAHEGGVHARRAGSRRVFRSLLSCKEHFLHTEARGWWPPICLCHTSCS